MNQPIVQIDAFSDVPFGGNPAAVCLLAEPRSDRWMQSVAVEMNLSETAFLLREGEGYRLRWFTPGAEVDLCGHATLASAHLLWEDGHLAPESDAVFETRSGRLTARRNGDWIDMDFPASTVKSAEPPADLERALGTPASFWGTGLYALAEVESETALRRMQPDIRRLAELHSVGVCVTAAASTNGFDFVSRFFAPAVGIDEDPVTGSAHCMLAPYWAERLGRSEMTAYQASPRGGVVRLRLAGDRVGISGQAVTVLRGELV